MAGRGVSLGARVKVSACRRSIGKPRVKVPSASGRYTPRRRLKRKNGVKKKSKREMLYLAQNGGGYRYGTVPYGGCASRQCCASPHNLMQAAQVLYTDDHAQHFDLLSTQVTSILRRFCFILIYLSQPAIRSDSFISLSSCLGTVYSHYSLTVVRGLEWTCSSTKHAYSRHRK